MLDRTNKLKQIHLNAEAFLGDVTAELNAIVEDMQLLAVEGQESPQLHREEAVPPKS